MKNTIPTGGLNQLITTNTKEAALLYSIAEVQPQRMPDGALSAARIIVEGKERVAYFFNSTPLADMIHQAFSTPGWEDTHGGDIPDQYMPSVVAMLKTAFHNMERCRDAVKTLQLNQLVRKNGKVYIAKKEVAA